jgi:selenocysteine-specific elongation factor
MPLTVGTAGHIDHGKTWLVRALTGKDTDRLPEEQRRGISIELGYAPLELPDGTQLSLIDVPGHERFVRTMVAGATGIDLFLLVLDAGEGARPQTLEHLAIVRLLGIEHGVVAVTKADAVDEETLELALEEARELVPAAEAVAVSAKTGAGLDELRAALGRAAGLVLQEHKLHEGAARLHVDRVFSLRGIGTVATGTLWSGTVGEGDVLRAEPGGRDVRIRSVQVHDRPVGRAEAGQRVALALPGVERSELRRGDVLIAPGSLRPSYRLDVALDELEPIADGDRLHVHHGTAAVPARVVRSGGEAQLRLAAPLVAARGDRVVLRGATTVGGGTVIDPAPVRHADPARFAAARRGETSIHAPALIDGAWQFSDEWLEELRATIESAIDRADPLDPGAPAPTEPWAKDVLARLPFERRGSRLYRPGATGTLGPRAAEADVLAAAVAAADPGAARADDAELARFLEREGRLVRLGDGWAVSPGAYERARAIVTEECAAAGEITLARFRDLAGCGRRDAQLLLERLDADGVTRRVGQARVLRRRPSAPAA